MKAITIDRGLVEALAMVREQGVGTFSTCTNAWIDASLDLDDSIVQWEMGIATEAGHFHPRVVLPIGGRIMPLLGLRWRAGATGGVVRFLDRAIPGP